MIESRGRTRRSSPPGAPDRRYFDNAGHLDPLRAERLLELGAEGRSRSELAFVTYSATEADDLAEELGEGTVFAMTTGEDTVSDDFNRDVEEDWGGPFVETTASTEFAGGTDESNIAEATREPFPTV
jgi:hypothetical protein